MLVVLIVWMPVFVRDWAVAVSVLMSLAEMQPYPDRHQGHACNQRPGHRVTERDC